MGYAIFKLIQPEECMHLSKLFFLALFVLIISCSNDDNPVIENTDKEEDIIDPVSLTGIEIISAGKKIVGLGNNLKISARAKYSDGTSEPQNVDWNSSNNNVAIVDSKGNVTGLDFGEAKITAAFENHSDEILVTVEKYSGGGNFVIKNGNNDLGGTLELPSNLSKPVPAFVYVHGSGPSTRQEGTLASTRLAPMGIAVLRYDKRGNGSSTGQNLNNVGAFNSRSAFDKLSDDAIAWVKFLKQHDAIDTEKIGIIGVSQAGWIMPVIASKSADIKYMVNIVGPAVSVGEEIFYSGLTGNTPQGNNNSGHTDEELDSLLAEFRGVHGFDPQPHLDDLSIPVIWVLGEKDYSIPVPKTVRILEKLVNENQKEIDIIVKPNANHSMIDITTGTRIDIWNGQDGILNWLSNKVL